MSLEDLNAVAVFVKVVDEKSFRAAARALGATKSTVSRKVAELEDALGARLLERTTRTLRLTDAGAAYYRQVAPALGALQDAGRAVADMQAQPTGRLRVSAPLELGQFVLAPIFAELMRRHPAVTLEIELTDRHVDLVEEGFDLALRAGPLPDSSLVARRLGRPLTMRLYASADYLRRRGTPRRPEALVHHDCLVMSGHRTPTTWMFRGKRKPVAVEVRPRVAANSFKVLLDLCGAGHGIARAPDFPMGEHAGLVTVLDEHCLPPTQLHALYPSARNLSPKSRAFLDLLEETFTS
jgi:DNA-binding transcriptional LysR family regulator